MWDEPRPPDVPVRVWRDWALPAVLVPVAALEGVLRPELDGRFVQAAVTAGLVLTLLWRRTRPLLVVAVAFGVSAAVPLVIGAPLGTGSIVFVVLLPYALGRWGSGRQIVLGALVMVGSVVAPAAVGLFGVGEVGFGVAVVAAALATGVAFRYRERDRVRALDQVALRERERLARELHDTVAHHVSAMAIRAQAGLATAPARPEAALDALRLIEQEASRALAEMRAVVRVLRVDQPGPRLADLEQLTGRPGHGPVVDLQLHGDVDGVSPPVAAAVHRLAQEAITNARRHARGATRIEVRVDVDDAVVRLRVGDDGEPGPVRSGAVPGYGLTGMIERVTLLGGTCEAGPDPDRGWTVRAELPR